MRDGESVGNVWGQGMDRLQAGENGERRHGGLGRRWQPHSCTAQARSPSIPSSRICLPPPLPCPCNMLTATPSQPSLPSYPHHHSHPCPQPRCHQASPELREDCLGSAAQALHDGQVRAHLALEARVLQLHRHLVTACKPRLVHLRGDAEQDRCYWCLRVSGAERSPVMGGWGP